MESYTMQRRALMQAGTTLLGAAALALPGLVLAQDKPLIEVWKTASCGCCHDWIAHLETNGFQVKANDVSEVAKTAQRQKFGMPAKLGSCHTGRVDSYVLEGHVPAREIHKMLKQRPTALGLTVPGMPVGSPGMDGPAYGGQQDPFDVLLVSRDGRVNVYQSYPLQS
jgi:hypothetical protein